MKNKFLKLSVAVCILFIMSGCAPEKPTVAVTNYPTEYLVKRIGGDYIDVENITKDGLYQTSELESNYKATLNDSDVLFYMNGLESYFSIYEKDIKNTDVDMVDLSVSSAIYKFQRYSSAYVNDKLVVVESPYYDEAIFENVNMYTNDPMCWMDPIIATSMAESIKDELISRYPEYKRAFNDNFDKLQGDLARLDAEYQSLVSSKLNVSIVTISSSFGYLQKSYGVDIYPVVLSKYGALPSETQYNEIVKTIKRDKVKYIAQESFLNKDMTNLYSRVIADCSLTPVSLSNLNALSEENKKTNIDYLTIMYKNLEVLEQISE